MPASIQSMECAICPRGRSGAKSSSRAGGTEEGVTPSNESSQPELQVLMTGIAFGEQPRWHEDRLWFSDWGSREVIAVDLEGNSDVMLRAPSFPCRVDWLPDGHLLVVSARDGLLLRREPDGTLVTHGDLRRVSTPPAGN